MDSLFHELGSPPYHLNQLLPLIDKASSIISKPQEISGCSWDTAAHIAELMEALAWLVEFCLFEVLPQFVEKVERLENGPCRHVYVPYTDRDIIDSITEKALHLKSWLFYSFHQVPEASHTTPNAARLCEFCRWPFQRVSKGPSDVHSAYLPKFPWPLDGSAHYLLAIDSWPAFHVLQGRSLQGCAFCHFLREQLLALPTQSPEMGESQRSTSLWIEFLWQKDQRHPGSTLKFVNVRTSGIRTHWQGVVFNVHTAYDNVANQLGISRPLATTSLDQTNIGFIERELALTEKSSPCTHYRSRRLLDIGSGAESEPKIIDGRQAETGPDGLKYATLSYCWGSPEQSRNQLKLTTKTQNTLYGSIPQHLITPVMRDAITVCRILALRYLWIDSICIRQDEDRTDWEEQSQEMSHIFGNSWLTICATASKSCLEGFLDHTDRRSRSIEIGYIPQDALEVRGSFSLQVLTADGQPGFRYCHLAPYMSPLQQDLQCSTWNKRGWVFQERSLSRRLLYFGARMIHFQHGSHVASEDGSCVDEDFFDDSPVLHFAPRFFFTNLLHQLETIQRQGPFITAFWYSLVPAISTSIFTDRKDIFPAIAGVARRVHEFTKHRYVAGLWEEDLCCGLLWIIDIGVPGSEPHCPANLHQAIQMIKKYATSIGPSWSWASRRTKLAFMVTNKTDGTCRIRLHLRSEFKILETRVLADGVNPYGRISEASIMLVGSTIRLNQSSVASMRLVSNRHKLCEISPRTFVLIRPDWDPLHWSNRNATGISKRMRAQFQLLMIASCCSDWSTTCNTRAAHGVSVEELAKPDASDHRPASQPQASQLSMVDMAHEETDKIFAEFMKPEYRLSLYHDSRPGFDAMAHCDLCTDHSLRRDIWGLLLYPAGAPDEFYRVGAFFSRAQHGGSAIFDSVERRRIKLV